VFNAFTDDPVDYRDFTKITVVLKAGGDPIDITN